MGNQNLESRTNESQEEIETNYKIITHKAQELPEDLKNIILAPFLNTLRYGNDMFKLIDKQCYFPNYSLYINNLLSRHNSNISMAMFDDVVLGWCLHDFITVHYVWVKNEVRRQGIGKSLLPKNFSQISHITNKGMNIWVSKFPGVIFNPWA